MLRTVSAVALALVLCASAFGENQRTLEENIVISPIIVCGKMAKAAGEVKEGGTTYKKFEVTVTDVVRVPAAGPKKSAQITAYGPAELKAGDEQLLFLSSKGKNGHQVHFAAKLDGLGGIKKLLALGARASKELDGTSKLAAAFFHAHKLRPVLLAAAEKKAVKGTGVVAAKEADKLLSILGWALQQSAGKGAKPEFKRLTEAYRRVLTGIGGLPEYNTRDTRVAQFWALRLKQAQQRKRYRLATLAMTDQPAQGRPASGPAVAVAVRGLNGQLFVGRAGMPYPYPRPTPKTPAKPEVVAPSEASLGKAVNGLVLGIHTERPQYDFRKSPEQTVNVTATFHNTGEAPVRLNSYMVFSMLVKVYLVDPGGRLSVHWDKSALEASDIPAMGPWSFNELKPGEKTELTEQIPADKFRASGRHQLYIVYKNKYGSEFGVKGAWTGEVASARIPLDVMRHDAPGPKPTPTPTKRTPPPRRVLPTVPRPVGQQLQIRQQGALQIQIRAVANGVVVQNRVIINGKEVQAQAKKKTQ